MGRTYITADLHICYNWTPEQYENIWEFQRLVTPEDIVICDGDTLEWVWRSKSEVLYSEEYHKFQENSRGQYCFAEGNHDIGNGLSVIRLDRGIIIMHGHQFDNLADTPWKRFCYCFAPFVRDIWWHSPFEQKMRGNKNWRLHNASIWTNAIIWLERNPHRLMIIGHTHDTCIIERPELGKKLVNIGSLPEDGIYAEVIEGRVIVRKITQEKELFSVPFS